MSLEATIQENTNAIRELIAAIKAGVPTTAAQVAAVVTEAKTTPCAEQKPEALTQMTASEAVQALDGIANRPADAPTYQAAASAMTKLARTKGREAAVAVLKQFGVSKLPEVKPEDFAAFISACEEAEAY